MFESCFVQPLVWMQITQTNMIKSKTGSELLESTFINGILWCHVFAEAAHIVTLIYTDTHAISIPPWSATGAII